MMKWIVAVAMAMLLPLLAIAGDIGDEVRRGVNQADDYDGGYIEFTAGIGCGYVSSITDEADYGSGRTDCDFQWGMGGEYRFKRLFLEASNHGQDGLNIGVNVWSNAGWSVDLLGASVYGRLTKREPHIDSETPGLSERARNYWILNRDTWYVGAGARVTRYIGDNIVQLRLVTDIHDSNGFTSTARFGRAWQVKNWNFHGLASLTYRSAETNQYHFGVSELEQTERFPAYSPGSTLETGIEVGVSYPLTQHWVFRSEVHYRPVPVAVQNSPIIKFDWAAAMETHISYVF